MRRPTELEFYLKEQLPVNVRLRAAIEAAPYELAKISAVAVGYLTGDTFAERLDRAIGRSERARLIEGRAEPTD
jgi:hypothetical protein